MLVICYECPNGEIQGLAVVASDHFMWQEIVNPECPQWFLPRPCRYEFPLVVHGESYLQIHLGNGEKILAATVNQYFQGETFVLISSQPARIDLEHQANGISHSPEFAGKAFSAEKTVSLYEGRV